jgi:hypothetical protein
MPMRDKTISQRLNLFGLLCLLMAAGLAALAVPLRCVARAAEVGGFSLLNGFVFGTALAMATRTRRPLYIYLCVGIAFLTFVPLVYAWPPGGIWDVTLQPGMPDIFANYLDLLRIALFLLGFPYPFARFGYHAPDTLPPDPQREGQG